MTEVAFARTFLALLDTKPQKILADHVEDPRNYPASTPYTLPRPANSKPMSKPRRRAAPSTSTSPTPTPNQTTTVHVKSLRNPPLEITLPNLPLPTTSALDIKTAVASASNIPLSKLKLLYSKKPVPDSKTLKDVLGGVDASAPAPAPASMEFSVMVMGGAASIVARPPPPPPVAADKDVDMTGTEGEGEGAKDDKHVAQGLSGAPVLETEQFWSDLKGFLQQRIRDEQTADELCGQFRGAWAAARR
ncbi:cell-cycle control medial ring component [Podospora appendiculata]|uniref:Cell-cycle control medial ring component n=1 Tax=Podospora appendiculata TaxID=314037 RepID=A0AAE1C939_9PEZI|nr:cell-cycle control medial ring component [Podospora appendiculata]